MSLLTLTGNLSWLYTSDIKRLWLRAFLIFMIRTIAASIWYWRSWKTLSVVLACSSTWNKSRGSNKNPNSRNSKETQGQIQTVSFIWIWLILILKSLCLKSLLHENLSPSSTSLLFGILVSTRAFPQASDCRVRRSSLSSAKRTETQRWDQGALRHELLTEPRWEDCDVITRTYSCRQLDLFQGEFLAFIKHQQHQCLEERHLQLLLALLWEN